MRAARISRCQAGAAWLAASALILSALAAGCSNQGAVTDADPPPNGATTNGNQPAPTPTPTPTYGALETFLARIYGYSLDPGQMTQAEQQAQLDAEGREREEMIAACMAEQGFNYYMQEHPGGIIGSPYAEPEPPADWPEYGTREWVERFGFGTSTDPWSWQYQEVAAPAPEYEWVDPNAEQLEAMSDAERTAWEEALWGVPQEGEWNWEDAGCSGLAQQEMYPSTPNQFAALETEMQTFFSGLTNDPRYLAANAEWAACMSENGQPGFTDVYSMYERLNTDWGVIQRWDEQSALYEGWNWELNPEGPDPADLPQPDPAAVATFQDWEITLALANYDCQQETQLEQTQQQIGFAAQQEFVDLHRDELEAWAQYMEEVRG